MAIKVVKKEITLEISGEDITNLALICGMAKRSVEPSMLWRDYISDGNRESMLKAIGKIENCIEGKE